VAHVIWKLRLKVDKVPVESTEGNRDDNRICFDASNFFIMFEAHFHTVRIPLHILHNMIQTYNVRISLQRLRSPIHNAVVATFHIQIPLSNKVREMFGRRLMDRSANPEFNFLESRRSPGPLVRGDQLMISYKPGHELGHGHVRRIRLLFIVPRNVIGKLVRDFLRLELSARTPLLGVVEGKPVVIVIVDPELADQFDEFVLRRFVHPCRTFTHGKNLWC
jgi:hypothetical protein